ncbi:MAG: response regulator [Spirochaetales bacterium]|nr:response regulator [Spirochaetales bacterium]
MGGRARILIVEDIYLVAKDLQESLEEMGYTVIDIVDSGKDAIERTGQRKPDLILMDIRLKGNMDGIEAASIIHETYNVPIIYVTAYADDHTLMRAKRTEPSGYIIKPFNRKELHSTIEMALYKQKIESFLKDREEFLAVTLRSISDAVITTDLKGYITFLNPFAENITGWSQDEAMGKHIDDVLVLVYERGEEMNVYPVRQTIEEDTTIVLENLFLLSRDKKRENILCSTSPIKDDKGSIIGTVVILRDMTEERRLQKELMKTQRLQSLAELAGSIGHEFNNLLTVILGNIELVKQGGGVKAEFKEGIEEAEIAAKKAKGLSTQLLMFSKRGEPAKKEMDVKKVMDSIIASSSRNARVEFEIDFADDLRRIEANEALISQAIDRMMKKAMSLFAREGKIIVKAENVVIDEKTLVPLDPGIYIRIEIREHDVLMPGEQLESMFNPNFSIEKRKESIDIASAYSIVKNHGGTIIAESGKDDGTVFYIYLPAIKERIPRDEASNNKQHIGKRVLVMDDHELVRIIAGKILNHLGFEVEFARHGLEAVELYKKAKENGNPFSVVFLDLTVNFGLGAIDTIQKLLEIDPKVKAVVSSGYSNDPIIQNYQVYGFCAVITKPYEIEDFNRILRKLR